MPFGSSNKPAIDRDVAMPTQTQTVTITSQGAINIEETELVKPDESGAFAHDEVLAHLAYSRMWANAKSKIAKFETKLYHVYFQPTPTGAEQFGWLPVLLKQQLLQYSEAIELRDYLALEHAGTDWQRYAFIKLVKFQIGANSMPGYNYQFDATQYEPEQWGGAHPAGNYEAYVSNTAVEENSEKNGGNFVVEFTTQAGSIRKYYPLWNPKPKAVEGAHKQLSALCHAVGKFRLDMNNEGQDLRGGRCRLEIGRQKPDDPDNNYMEIKKIFTMDGGIPGKSNQQQGQQPGQQGGFGGQPQQQQPQGGGFGGGQPQQGQAPAQNGGFGGQGPAQGGFGGGGGQPAAQGGFGGGGAPAQNGGGFGQQGPAQQQPAQQVGGWQQGAGGGDNPSWATG